MAAGLMLVPAFPVARSRDGGPGWNRPNPDTLAVTLTRRIAERPVSPLPGGAIFFRGRVVRGAVG